MPDILLDTGATNKNNALELKEFTDTFRGRWQITGSSSAW